MQLILSDNVSELINELHIVTLTVTVVDIPSHHRSDLSVGMAKWFKTTANRLQIYRVEIHNPPTAMMK